MQTFSQVQKCPRSRGDKWLFLRGGHTLAFEKAGYEKNKPRIEFAATKWELILGHALGNSSRRSKCLKQKTLNLGDGLGFIGDGISSWPRASNVQQHIISCWWKESQTTTWDANPVNNGINYQPQLVSLPDFWTINSSMTSVFLQIVRQGRSLDHLNQALPPMCWTTKLQGNFGAKWSKHPHLCNLLRIGKMNAHGAILDKQQPCDCDNKRHLISLQDGIVKAASHPLAAKFIEFPTLQTWWFLFKSAISIYQIQENNLEHEKQL